MTRSIRLMWILLVLTALNSAQAGCVEMKPKFSKTEINCIKRWLSKRKTNRERYDSCPFPNVCHKTGKTCHALFPKLEAYNYDQLYCDDQSFVCPCDQYSVTYVMKVAKKAVEEYENESGTLVKRNVTTHRIR